MLIFAAQRYCLPLFCLMPLLLLLGIGVVYASDLPLYELRVKLLPDQRALEATAVIALPRGENFRLNGSGLSVSRVRADGRVLSWTSESEITLPGGTRMVELTYKRTFSPYTPKMNVKNVGVVDQNVLDSEKVMLMDGWYPSLNRMCRYRLTVELPEHLEAISEGTGKTVALAGGVKTVRFDFPYPVPGISLIAGTYTVRERTARGIQLKAYFFPQDADLADDYLDKTARFLGEYVDLLGPYPYPEFAIVENALQTGYSLPTYTLLGSRVVRLPFIVNTSLGHELMHQWFGNSVYADHRGGNWGEGLTSYLADHGREEKQGNGDGYRKKLLLNYMNYVPAEAPLVLRDFGSRTDFASSAVGYGKASLVFHMLRKRVGDLDFFARVKEFAETYRFKTASWDDLLTIFLQAADSDRPALEAFFAQWLDRPGIPSLSAGGAQMIFRDGMYQLSFDLTQRDPPFALDLPVKVITDAGEETFTLSTAETRHRFSESFRNKPVRVVIDGGYDTFRSLSPSEKPPVISAFTGNKGSLVVLPEGREEEYREVADFFEKQGYPVVREEKLTNQELGAHSALLLSHDSLTCRRLLPRDGHTEPGFYVTAHINPLNPSTILLVFAASDMDQLQQAYRKIFRYGTYTHLHFENGQNTATDRPETDRGIIIDLTVPMHAVEPANTLDLDQILPAVQDSRIMYIGESHETYAHHLMQLEIIRRLHQAGGKTVIGMEMFQRPFQEALDQYVRGEISEVAFLRGSEYFQRWGFDYNLYRDILHYARANHIPVVALNIRKEIIAKVSRGGLDALTEEERTAVPADMDLTNPAYREKLRAVYRGHGAGGGISFENFHQSQILWDTSMAQSVAEAMVAYPEARIVVLAGNGHLMHAWGIPHGVEQRTGIKGPILLCDIQEGMDPSLADYVLYPAPVPTPASPKLGVVLTEQDNTVRIKEVSHHGPAGRAGVKPEDTIVAFNGIRVSSIADIKIELLSRKPGDRVVLTVKRKRLHILNNTKDLEVLL